MKTKFIYTCMYTVQVGTCTGTGTVLFDKIALTLYCFVVFVHTVNDTMFAVVDDSVTSTVIYFLLPSSGVLLAENT